MSRRRRKQPTDPRMRMTKVSILRRLDEAEEALGKQLAKQSETMLETLRQRNEAQAEIRAVKDLLSPRHSLYAMTSSGREAVERQRDKPLLEQVRDALQAEARAKYEKVVQLERAICAIVHDPDAAEAPREGCPCGRCEDRALVHGILVARGLREGP